METFFNLYSHHPNFKSSNTENILKSDDFSWISSLTITLFISVVRHRQCTQIQSNTFSFTAFNVLMISEFKLLIRIFRSWLYQQASFSSVTISDCFFFVHTYRWYYSGESDRSMTIAHILLISFLLALVNRLTGE